MSKNRINSWKDCTDSRKVEGFAREKGLSIRECAGSHKMMSDNNGNQMTFYKGDISTGVACKIYKWFKVVGLLVFFLGCSLGYLILTGRLFIVW
jgi:hypothetical protein